MSNTPSTQQIEAIRKEHNPLLDEAQSLKVTDEPSAIAASKFVKRVSDAIRNVETKRREYVDPLNSTLRSINTDMKSIKAPLEEAKAAAMSIVMAWKSEQERKAAAEEVRRQKIQEAHAKKGHEVSAPAYVPKPLKTTGHIQSKKVWTFDVVDKAKVSDAFKEVDSRLVRAALREGVREIDGLKIYQVDQGAVV